MYKVYINSDSKTILCTFKNIFQFNKQPISNFNIDSMMRNYFTTKKQGQQMWILFKYKCDQRWKHSFHFMEFVSLDGYWKPNLSLFALNLCYDHLHLTMPECYERSNIKYSMGQTKIAQKSVQLSFAYPFALVTKLIWN